MCPTDCTARCAGRVARGAGGAPSHTSKGGGEHVLVHLVRLLELKWRFTQPKDPPVEQLVPWEGDQVFFARYFPPWQPPDEDDDGDAEEEDRGQKEEAVVKLQRQVQKDMEVLEEEVVGVNEDEGGGNVQKERWETEDCWQCGWPWTTRHRCPAWGVSCHKCGLPNHYARMCRFGVSIEDTAKEAIFGQKNGNDSNNNSNKDGADDDDDGKAANHTHSPIFPTIAFSCGDIETIAPQPARSEEVVNVIIDTAENGNADSQKKPHRKRKKTPKQRKRDQERLQKFLEKKAQEQQLLEQRLEVKEIAEMISVVASSVIVEDLTRQREWDAETLKTRMDQLPEQHVVTMDTAVSTSVEAGEGNRMSPNRPDSLESTPKKRIVPNLALLRDEQLQEPGQAAGSPSSSEGVPLDSLTDLQTPDDLNTPEALGDSVFEGELDWEDSDASEDVPVPPIPEYTAREEFEDEKNWRSVTVGDRTFRIDMKVIEPYKRVLSHGGYYGDGFNAIIVFTGYYLPDKRRRDYNYVMDNLFLYVLSTLELLVVEDYMVVYFHGATPKQRMPSLRWLKRCYEMIDRRLRKNLKSLLIVHPTLWIKTIMTLTKPFISSKFSSKLKYVRGLKELADAVPMEYIFVPDEIKMFDEAKFRQSAPAAT